MDENDSPRASVVIPTHNRAHLVIRAIESVLAQTFEDFELIVVDDASTDDTTVVVAGIEDPRVRVLHSEVNVGGAAARDLAIDVAQGEYVAFLDSDDEWLPGFLAAIDAVFSADEAGSIGVVETGAYEPDGSVTVMSAEDVYEQLLALDRHICFSSIAARRSLLGTDLRFGNPSRLAQERQVFMALAQRAQYVSIPQPLARIHREEGEHLLTPANQLTKRMHMLDTHAEELRERPKVLARHYGTIGNLHVSLGDRASARMYFWRAFTAWPRDPKWLARWATTLAGRRGDALFRSLAHVYHALRNRETEDTSVGNA